MQRLGTGMTMRFNTKHHESGRLFQGAYKARRIDRDSHFAYVSVYVQVKNPFELYADFLRSDLKKSAKDVNFDEAFEWATQYPYCSLGDYTGNRKSPIITKDLLGEMYPTPSAYKKLAYECLVRMDIEERLKKLKLEG